MLFLKRKHLPLKTVYYISFLCFIVIPLLVVLLVSLLILNQQFKKQALENIRRAQDNVVTELKSDINVMSMRLSHMIYTNNNEIMEYAAGTDNPNVNIRYDFEQKLTQAGNLALEPVKDIISVVFYMKSGRETYFKSNIKRSAEEIKAAPWYQAALETPNSVCVGSCQTMQANDLYTGGRKDLLVLVFALSPDVTTDRSGTIEMVTFWQYCRAGDRIREYNQNYNKGLNRLGITIIVNEEGETVFATEEIDTRDGRYVCVESPVELVDSVWYVRTYIKSFELTGDFRRVSGMILATAVLILSLAAVYSGYFLRKIVKPIEEISGGLKQVEEGNLSVHVAPKGQSEIRGMIHQFNAMVRRLGVLIQEYEERVRSAEMTYEQFFQALIKREMTPEEVHARAGGFFADRYCLLGLWVDHYPAGESETVCRRLIKSFERNPRFASRCLAAMEKPAFIYIFYRITETDFTSNIVKMTEEMQREATKEFGVELSLCIGQETNGAAGFAAQSELVERYSCIRYLKGRHAVTDLNREFAFAEKVLQASGGYRGLADALYIADEKNLLQERERFFSLLNGGEREENFLQAYAAVLAIGMRFDADPCGFTEIFGDKYNYIEKIERLGDIRGIKLWLTNYFAWIMDYSAAKLNAVETDVIVKAKRYMADHYEEADLSLLQVAEYVGLNEKYFTNRFTKEAGENFSSYLTGLRLQKAKELLKTTSFKIYEIAGMAGYRNVEHFNRTFKKHIGITPAQFRKTM